LTSVIEKRQSIHKQLEVQQQENDALKSQVCRLQALANIGTATAMIAHEMNNLLAPLAGHADLALKNPDDTKLADKALKKALRNSQRASNIVESILALANGEDQHYADAPLSSLVQEVFDGLGRDFTKDSITVSVQIPEDLTIRAVPVQIQQAIMNLILNGRAAMLGNGGRLTIKAHDGPEAIDIEVTDTGCGIEPENLRRIFEPFFTTKAVDAACRQSQAVGLGLAFCKRIIDAHKGSISVESEAGRGSTFIISLPKPK
jgi:signal transduction histidine kinase